MQVIIKADYNDGDYDMCKTEINEEDLIKLKSILDKMPKSTGYYTRIRYETQEIGDDDKHNSKYQYITPEEKDFLGEYLPLGDPSYSGIHTIESVEVVEIIEKLL